MLLRAAAAAWRGSAAAKCQGDGDVVASSLDSGRAEILPLRSRERPPGQAQRQGVSGGENRPRERLRRNRPPRESKSAADAGGATSIREGSAAPRAPLPHTRPDAVAGRDPAAAAAKGRGCGGVVALSPDGRRVGMLPPEPPEGGVAPQALPLCARRRHGARLCGLRGRGNVVASSLVSRRAGTSPPGPRKQPPVWRGMKGVRTVAAALPRRGTAGGPSERTRL